MAASRYDNNTESLVNDALPDYEQGGKSSATRRPGTTTKKTSMDGLDSSASNLLDFQTKELQRYREALRKLGQDVLSLRQQVRTLEADNGRLRRDLALGGNTGDGSRRLVDTLPYENLTKAELIQRYANLKVRFDQLADELRDYKDRVQKLQSGHIPKSDIDRSLLWAPGWSGINSELRRQFEDEVERSRTLEATRDRQAMAIADLEKEVANLRIARYNDTALVNEENLKLRLEVSRLKDDLDMRPARDIPREIAWADRLDAAQARIRELEQQLMDESHQWHIERANLLAELRDAKTRWLPVYAPPPAPTILEPLIIRKKSGKKPPWRPHHGSLSERQRKETILYKSPSDE